ncbi:MAG: co-chaperone DjlA, partial [Gammaproteobacteria bacterium]
RGEGWRGAAGPLAEAYAALGLAPGAPAEEVRRAYRRLMSRHHPDKLAARGAGEAERRRALARAQAVQAAYARLRRAGRA